jgi:(heptosyl)LPS beta-1,4-glucosyltransferase
MVQHPSGNSSYKLATRRSVRRRMTWDSSLPDDVVSALWDSPEDVLRQGKCLQSKSRTTVARVDFASGPYLLKFHHWAGFWKTLTKSLAVSPNRRSFNDGLKLADRGVPTPLPLACVDVRLGPLNTCSYLLTEFVSGTSLYRTMRFGEPNAIAVDHFAQQVADIWQMLDEMQFCHNDLKPENLMIDDDYRVWLIDLENGRWHTDLQSLRHYQREDAKRLLHIRSWQANTNAAEKFRQRLLATQAVQAGFERIDDQFHPLKSAADVGAGTPKWLTVFIPCLNAVNDIRGCIEAVRDFADEILVADAGSNDGTLELLQNLDDCRVVRIDSLDPDIQRRAIDEASHPWVLLLEPTERVSSDLAKEIQFLLADNPSGDGFCIERRCHFFGHVIRFGDSKGYLPVRLVRRDCCALLEADQLNGKKHSEKVDKLRGTIEYRIWTIEQLTAALADSAYATANEWHARGRRPSLARVLLHAPLNFVTSYFLKLGCLDGLAGMHFALISAVFVYVRYARLWQLQHGLPHPDGEVTQPTVLKLVAPEACVEENSIVPRRKAA